DRLRRAAEWQAASARRGPSHNGPTENRPNLTLESPAGFPGRVCGSERRRNEAQLAARAPACSAAHLAPRWVAKSDDPCQPTPRNQRVSDSPPGLSDKPTPAERVPKAPRLDH